MDVGRLRWRAGCADGPCPNVFDTEVGGMVAVQGTHLTDPAALAQINLETGEQVVTVPRSLLVEYAHRILEEEGGR